MAFRRATERRPALATYGACVGIAGCVVWAVLVLHRERIDALTAVLIAASAATGYSVVQIPGSQRRISGSFLVGILAATFLGPVTGLVSRVLAEVATSRVLPTRRRALLINIVGAAAPTMLVGVVVWEVAPHDHHLATFYVLIAGLAFGALVLNWMIIAALFIALDGDPQYWARSLRDWRQMLPTILINIVLSVAGAAIYVLLGLPGIIFALVAVVAFSYQSKLVARAEERAQAYSSLSWGVLAGLMRALDTRDQRAARHAAAVARFARDMARAVGMDERESELAHTAGLLHDIGRFALSDRVAERGRTLTDEDWMAIQRHPELGADMLKDLGIYGPVAEIVRAHHERVDGRGYPRGLAGDEIPEIAKIIAVAEVYDTLTASDTYRTRKSSFEALRELRRVAGSQLDEHYVEVLAGLLGGEGVEYRHADMADFDSELDMERRIKEAGAR